MSFIGYIRERYPETLPVLFNAISESIKTDLNLHLDILETDWPTLTEEFKT